MELLRFETPLENELIEELVRFWQEVFGFVYSRSVLAGDEACFNRDIIYVAREDGKIAGTCHLTVPCGDNAIAGLGEVATDPVFRGRGIAGRLCSEALSDFKSLGGHALFLGTGNPKAASVYERLGWENIQGSSVWVNLIGFDTSGDFYEEYFAKSSCSIIKGGAKQRIGLIPLIVYPHKQMLLDWNTGIYSTLHTLQKSCMGLYGNYEKYQKSNDGAWFCSVNEKGRLTGISTVFADGSGSCSIDGFSHPEYDDVLPELLERCTAWAEEKGYSKICAVAAATDTDKKKLFKSLGFKAADKEVCPGIGGLKTEYFISG